MRICKTDLIQRGVVGSKPEAIRQALMEYFNKLDEQQLRHARLRLLEKESAREREKSS